MALILDNAYTDDTYDMRGDRLSLMSANVDSYAAEIALPDDLKNWGIGSYAEWESTLVSAGVERGQRDTAFETYQRLFNELRDGYLRVKELLWALIEDTEDGIQIAEQYDIIQQTPRIRRTLKVSAVQIKETSDILRAEGDPRVLAEPIIDTLIAKTDAMETAWQTAQKEKKESSAAFDTLASLYNEDAQKLRLVYNYATLSWGKYDPKLILLGFAPSVVRPGGGQPDAPEALKCDIVTKTFSWDVVAEATSYQLAFSADGIVWDEAYAGSETSVVFDPGTGVWKFRVRARDVDGFGDWSEVLPVNFSGGALAAPTGFKFDDTSQEFLWKIVPDADSYQLEYSRDGGQTWLLKYHGVDNKFDATGMDPGKCLARVRALNATETSPWGITLDVWLGVPAIPLNLRWEPEEYHGDMFAKIEWDIAGGATNYQLHCINDGEFFNTGTNTFQYEDIMGSPGEHEYKVRAENGYGWSEFSPMLVFVI